MTFSEKVKLIRKSNNFTQAEFADIIGISRGHLANIETNKVSPTNVIVNCISLTFHINKKWLIDDNNTDLQFLNGTANMANLIASKYELLDTKYKSFVENQIAQLLEMQKSENE